MVGRGRNTNNTRAHVYKNTLGASMIVAAAHAHFTFLNLQSLENICFKVAKYVARLRRWKFSEDLVER